MKFKIFTILASVLTVFAMTSCHDDAGTPDVPKNDCNVSLRSLAVEVNNAEKVIESRASIDLSDFIVQIYNETGSKVKEWRYADMPEVFTITEGKYTVKVYSHEVQKAEWEHPYFVGEKEFTVAAGTINEIGIVTCKLSNIKVTIKFAESLRKYMADDCKVTVIANDQGRLEFTPDETRSGYFEALEGSSTLVAEFSGTVGGHATVLRHVCSDVEGGQHRIITFKIKDNNDHPGESGGIEIGDGIVLDASTVDEDLNANINIGEDVLDPSDRPGSDETPDDGGDPDPGPGPDDPDENDLTITSQDVDFDKVNEIKDKVVVAIDSKHGIEHLQVTITTDNAGFRDAVSELMPLSFDLAYPGDMAEAFSSLGFPVGSEVIGSTHVDFDISQFVPLLSAFPGTHNFQISVTDSKSKQVVKTLTFKS